MYIQVITTINSKEEATKIADVLLDKKLAACIQVSGPIESYYTWQGKKEISKEFVVTIKTKRAIYNELENEIKKLHSYEIPEIIVLQIQQGNKEYLDWVEKNTK